MQLWVGQRGYRIIHICLGKNSEAKVAAAGVTANLLIAIIGAILYRIITFVNDTYNLNQNLNNNTLIFVGGSTLSYLFSMVITLLAIVVVVNINLAIFNLLPLPPFDGLRIITSLSHKWGRVINDTMSRYHYQFIIVSLFIAYNIAPHIFNLNMYIIKLLL